MPFDQLKRREFVTLVGGAAVWPLAARAQSGRMRRVGVLMNGAARRRELITLLGGAVAAWPLAPRAQQPASLRFNLRSCVIPATMR